MTQKEFKDGIAGLLDTTKIGQSPELRRYYYELFDDLYLYLESQDWGKESLIEHGELNTEAYFQNIAEAYFRLGMFEMAFYNFSKLVYDLWYQKVLEYQSSSGERFHKGTQVHQIGIILDLLGSKDSAWDYYLAGLIEDLQSNRPMETSQAFRMLRVLGMPRAEIEVFQSKVKVAGAIFDPLDYVTKLREKSTISTFEENSSIDFNKLKQAEILWKEVLKQKKGGENG